MELPKITVYITNFNYEKWINQAILSVLDQKFQDFELLIIDDGSTDNSRELIETYRQNPKIQIIYQSNKGLNATNNVALKKSKGKYIMRLDADDFLHVDALEVMSTELDTDGELGLICPNYFYVEADGEIIGEEIRHDFESDVKLLDQPAHGACTMIRKTFLEDLGGYDESYTCQDGYELWVKFTRDYKVGNIQKSLFYYRQHGSNLTSSETKILDTRSKINRKFVQQSQEKAKAIAVIPVRGGMGDLAFKNLNSENLLHRKIKEILRTDNFKKIIVTSPDEKVRDLISPFQGEVDFHLRPSELAKYSQSLVPTIENLLQDLQHETFNIIGVLTLEYPFVTSQRMDDAVNAMVLFKSDSLIAVRSDNSVFYQHHGDGLHPILNRNEFHKLERDVLYKQVGGINIVSKTRFLEDRALITGTVGHIILDQKSAYGLFSKYDWSLAEILNKG